MQKIRDKIEKTEVSQQKKKYQQNVQFFFHGNVPHCVYQTGLIIYLAKYSEELVVLANMFV